MTTTLELISAIANGDAVGIEDTFNAAMAEKISAKLDDLRVSVAQAMFNAEEPVVEEGYDPEKMKDGDMMGGAGGGDIGKTDKKKKSAKAVFEDTVEFTAEEWEALSEEEQAEYEIIDEASLKDAQKSLKANYGQAHDTHGDFDTSRKDQAAAKVAYVKAKKVIKTQGGDYNKTKAQAVKKFEKDNSY